MPSQRFHKLNPIKKRTFLRMAYKEFAVHSYEGASITQLVSDLKMAKGSIYHYFEDKKDMYNYLVEHAYGQLHLILTKACPLPESSQKFDSWYKNYLLVYIKFLCSIPTYAFLFIRNKADFSEDERANESLIIGFIPQSSNNTLSKEREYFFRSLPLLIFNYILESEQIDKKEIIESGNTINISSDKLLYLCDAFLYKK